MTRLEDTTVVDKLSIALCSLAVALCAEAASASDRSVRWGIPATSRAPNITVSPTTHNIDSQTAVIVEGGRTTLLPGATINSVGVLNQVSVVGDDNLIDAMQTGTNNGDVSTTVSIAD